MSDDPEKPAPPDAPAPREDPAAAHHPPAPGAPPGESPRDPPGPEKKPAGPPWYRRPLPVGLLVLAVLVVGIGGALWWIHSRQYVSTDDAFVDVVPEQVSPQISGRVLRVLINDNDDVRAGQPLVELDPSDYQNQLEQARANAARAESQVAQAEAQQQTSRAQVLEREANLVVARANARNAARDLARFRELQAEDGGAVSVQQLDHAIAADETARAQVDAAEKTVAAARAQVDAADSQIVAARAGLQSAAAQTALANLDLSHARVLATLSGRIAKRTVAPGNYVTTATRLMAVVPRDVYVTANFKETQLAHLRVGQKVEIRVDAYPDRRLAGHVDSLQPGTGQTFSELPAENATGNWVKVVQRVAVKIVLDDFTDDPQRRLGPGMSVVVKVTVR